MSQITDSRDRPTASGKVIPVPRVSQPRPPAERLTIPKVRSAWEQISPSTIVGAAPLLWLTVRAIKHRRHDSEAGQFPDPIDVIGRYHQAGALYDLRMLQLWKDNCYDLRNAPKGEVTAIRRSIDRAVKAAEPVHLSSAADILRDRILPSLGDVSALSAEDVEGRVYRRLRNWRETWTVTGFPEPLPISADSKTSEMVFSLAELRAWFDRREAAGN